MQKANQWTDRVLKEDESGTGNRLGWNRRLALQLLRREADSLLVIRDYKETKSTKKQETADQCR